MLVPKPRGPLSEALFEASAAGPTRPRRHSCARPRRGRRRHAVGALRAVLPRVRRRRRRGGVGARLLAVRRRLERDLEAPAAGRVTGPPRRPSRSPRRSSTTSPLTTATPWPRHVQRQRHREQVLDLLRVRSLYHLKEADPTTWVVPRLPAAPKAALVELQYDEYGAGDPNRLHAHLFAQGHGGHRPACRVRRLRRRGARSRSSSRTTRCRCSACTGGCAAPPGPPGRVRGHELAAVAPDGAGPRAAGLPAGARGATTPSTSRRTPSTSSWPSAASAAHSWRPSRRWPTTSCSARSPASTSRTGSRDGCSTQWGVAA